MFPPLLWGGGARSDSGNRRTVPRKREVPPGRIAPEQVSKTLILAVPDTPGGREASSAGKRGWDVAVHPQDLIRRTSAVTAEIRAEAAD